MGTTPLRQLLKSLCSNSPWNYAVLWKLRYQNPLILTWEDGYYVSSGPRDPAETIANDIYSSLTSDIFSPYCLSSTSDGGLGGYSVGPLVANMSQLQYTWDEEVIGKVVRTEKHCWVSGEDILTGKADSRLFSECPEEWLLQFTSGIKTIVLIPVLPHGVLQLGSLEIVPEDLEFISHVKERFTLQTAGGNALSLSLKRNFEAQSSAAPVSSVKLEDSMTFDRFKPGNAQLTLDQVVPALNFQNSHLMTAKNLQDILDSASRANFGTTTAGPSEESSPLNQSMKASEPEMVESGLFGSSYPEEDLMTHLSCNSFNLDDYGGFLSGILNPNHSKFFVEEPFGGENVNDLNHEALSSFFSFPSDCELHKALGPAFKRDSEEYFLDSSIPSEDLCSNSTPRALVGGTEPVNGGSAGDLLQAVISNIHGGSDESYSPEYSGGKSSLTSAGHKAVTSTPPQVIPAFVSGPKRDCNTVSSPLSSTMTTLNDGELHRKGRKPPNGRKKRDRLSNSQKQRPRDRQLIQDRVKELRELVPNGAKCSIDGLLDHTIKHMLYLQSMTNQAEKLKQWVHQEVAGRKNLRSFDPKEESQKGKSWAFEIGSEQQVCPIIVEDLPHPGHLLIEMLCNEQGMFLEIAQVIRSFNLTILKGVMESSEKNTWAHFIVETSRGFHRLDIFWPLMQLLQRRRNPISSKI